MLRNQSRWSRNYLLPVTGTGAQIIYIYFKDIYCIQFGGCWDKEKPPLRRISEGTTYRYCNVKVWYSFKWQNMAGAVAEAGAEIMDKGGAGAENK